MPYYVAVYDVHARRVARVMNVFRRYLHHVQNSVFEGALTDAQRRRLEADVQRLIDPSYDTVILYRWADEHFMEKTVMGNATRSPTRFIGA